MSEALRIVIRKALSSENGTRILEIDTHVCAGELLAISGSSGCGKSTLLRILAGLAIADEGCITCGSAVWFDSAAHISLAPQQRCCALVFQDYALFPNMTLGRNLEFALRSPKDRGTLETIVNTLGIQELLGRKPHQVSGGQRQRAAFARALVSRPALLLLDEPFSSLDWELRARLQDELRQWHREFDCTTLMVSHDLVELFRVADRVMRLDGAPPSLRDLDKLAESYAKLRDWISPFPE